jgi:hypothetical protein
MIEAQRINEPQNCATGSPMVKATTFELRLDG